MTDTPLPIVGEYVDDALWTPQRRLAHLLTFLTEHPELHDQTIWVAIPEAVPFRPPTPSFDCGTTACAAGWVALFAGAEPIDWEQAYLGGRNTSRARWRSRHQRSYSPTSGWWIDDIAGTLLAFSVEEGQHVFEGSIDFDELIERALGTETGREMAAAGLWPREGGAST